MMEANTSVADLNETVSSESISNSTEDAGTIRTTLSNVILGTGLIVLVLITIAGNAMVLAAVYVEKRLQTTFNYYLVNLAITDLAVAVTAMSFYAISNILGYWPFGEFMCGVWIFFDYGMTFVSVFTLLLISIDRYWSITWYLHYRQHHTHRTCLLSIAAAWMFMLVLWLPPCIMDRIRNSVPGECKWEPSLNPIFVIIVAVLGHHGSCFILLFCYVKVFLFMRNKRKVGMLGTSKRSPVPCPSFYQTSMVATIAYSEPVQQPTPGTSKHVEVKHSSSSELHINQNNKQPENSTIEQKDTRMSRRQRDSKVFVTLTYIIAGYAICWVPFHFVFDISCIKDSLVPENVFTVTFWMTYLNSTINPILYSHEFRNAFRKLLSRRR